MCEHADYIQTFNKLIYAKSVIINESETRHSFMMPNFWTQEPVSLSWKWTFTFVSISSSCDIVSPHWNKSIGTGTGTYIKEQNIHRSKFLLSRYYACWACYSFFFFFFF